MKPTYLNLLRVASFATLLTGISATAFAQASTGNTFHITNASGYDIYRIYVSSSNDPNWHRDLLGAAILQSGEAVNIVNIPPGAYDLKLVDEDGDACVRVGVGFFEDRSLTITNNWLLGCEFHTRR